MAINRLQVIDIINIITLFCVLPTNRSSGQAAGGGGSTGGATIFV
jgi:hypothetical protein